MHAVLMYVCKVLLGMSPKRNKFRGLPHRHISCVNVYSPYLEREEWTTPPRRTKMASLLTPYWKCLGWVVWAVLRSSSATNNDNPGLNLKLSALNQATLLEPDVT